MTTAPHVGYQKREKKAQGLGLPCLPLSQPLSILHQDLGPASWVGVQLGHIALGSEGSHVCFKILLAFKFFIIFEQGTPCFHFSQGPTNYNYVTNPAKPHHLHTHTHTPHRHLLHALVITTCSHPY